MRNRRQEERGSKKRTHAGQFGSREEAASSVSVRLTSASKVLGFCGEFRGLRLFSPQGRNQRTEKGGELWIEPRSFHGRGGGRLFGPGFSGWRFFSAFRTPPVALALALALGGGGSSLPVVSEECDKERGRGEGREHFDVPARSTFRERLEPTVASPKTRLNRH